MTAAKRTVKPRTINFPQNVPGHSHAERARRAKVGAKVVGADGNRGIGMRVGALKIANRRAVVELMQPAQRAGLFVEACYGVGKLTLRWQARKAKKARHGQEQCSQPAAIYKRSAQRRPSTEKQTSNRDRDNGKHHCECQK